MTIRIAALAAIAALALPAAAHAGIPVTAEATCPLNGQVFTFQTTASYSIWGRALDGLPQGSWTFPLTLPQCPGSRFPALEEMTAEQVDAARLLVETPEYQAIRDEAPYYVLSFVMTRLGMGEPIDQTWHILQATWQAQGDAEPYGRYARELSMRWDAILPAFRVESPDDWWWIDTYVANVERQSGRADAALARLDALEAAGPGDPEVVERIALTRRLIAEGNTEPFASAREF